jgi:RNA polymerase sigma-70 factor, ECF subfamily
LHDARRSTRADETGALVLLGDQDRTRWNREQIAEGVALVERALRRGPGPYQLQAAIAALHAEAQTADETDWPQIAALYRVLGEMSPSAVIELNRAVAVAMADGPAAGLAIVERIAASGQLEEYPYLHSTRADLLRRLELWYDAGAAYRRALALTANGPERAYLERRLAELGADTA